MLRTESSLKEPKSIYTIFKNGLSYISVFLYVEKFFKKYIQEPSFQKSYISFARSRACLRSMKIYTIFEKKILYIAWRKCFLVGGKSRVNSSRLYSPEAHASSIALLLVLSYNIR